MIFTAHVRGDAYREGLGIRSEVATTAAGSCAAERQSFNPMRLGGRCHVDHACNLARVLSVYLTLRDISPWRGKRVRVTNSLQQGPSTKGDFQRLVVLA